MTQLRNFIPENYLAKAPKSKKTSRIKEDDEPLDLYAMVTDPTNNLTKESKKAFLEAVRKYNGYSESIYRNHNLKEISQTVSALGKLAEKIAVNEADDWFDGITVKRDMKSLQDSVKIFEVSCKEMSQLQHRLESVYEEVGQKLGKYFEITDSNNKVVEATKMQKLDKFGKRI